MKNRIIMPEHADKVKVMPEHSDKVIMYRSDYNRLINDLGEALETIKEKQKEIDTLRALERGRIEVDLRKLRKKERRTHGNR